MPKRIGLLLILILFSVIVNAQKKLNFPEVDKHSYELFVEKKWPELIEYANLARNEGIDFFYLQVRTGIAWYNLKKYRNAGDYFLKAYKTDSSFEWLQEYVYYSLIFSGRKLLADKLASDFSNVLKKKIGFTENGIKQVSYEGGYSYNTSLDELELRSFKTEVQLGSDYGETYLLKDYSFHTLDLSHRAAKNMVLLHSLTYTDVNREALVDWENRYTSQIKINQFNYYISPTWIIGKKLNVSPSLNLIFGSGDVFAGNYSNGTNKHFSLTKSYYYDLVFSTTAWADFNYFSPGIEVNAANINDNKFMQLSAFGTFYPLSNLKLYFTPKIYFKSTTNSIDWNTFGLTSGYQLGKLHLNAQYIFGNMNNFIESGGYVINNFSDRSSSKFMGSIFFQIAKKQHLFFRYINNRMTGDYKVYTGGIKSNSIEYNYSKNTITGGITWNF